MTRFLQLSLFFAATVVAGTTSAQGRIATGASASGALTRTDSRMNSGARFDLWTYSGTRGERITVTVRSIQFDAFVLVQKYPGGSSPVLARDDDGGSGSDASVELVLPETDDYLITVTSADHDETGAYRVTVRSDRASTPAPRAVTAPVTPTTPEARVITADRRVTGTLTTTPSGQLGAAEGDWRYAARKGETITVDLHSSEFDPFLTLYSLGQQGVARVAQDDNGGGALNARVVYRVPSDGEYVVRAERRHSDRTGSYTLSVRSSARSARTGAGVPESPTLDRNSRVRGRLDNSDPKLRDGTPYDVWTYLGRAGESVRLTLRSNDFDAFLSIGTISDGVFRSIESADDGAGGNDSLIEVILPITGEYVIRANALSPSRRTGSYTLRIDSLR